MFRLKPVYPLYLANEPQQPNADLEVVDKFTGEVAFRLADHRIIDAGIAAAVEAAEPMARMASYERRAVLQHSLGRFRERFDELAHALVDNMPYGGVKDSGLGREGVRFAMEDMTEIRNLVIRRRDTSPASKPGE